MYGFLALIPLFENNGVRTSSCLSRWIGVRPKLLALLNSRESTRRNHSLMSQSSDSDEVRPGSAANSAANSASASAQNSRQGSPIAEEHAPNADAGSSADQEPKQEIDDQMNDEMGSEMNMDVDANEEIDLDALFAGEIPTDLNKAPDAASEKTQNGDSAAPESQNADSKSDSHNENQDGAQNGDQNGAQNGEPAGAADDLDMIFNAPQGEPLLNDPNNDPLLDMELPLDSGVPLGQEPVFQTKEEAERERMKLLVSHFDEQQMSRYAAYRRANIRRASVKKFTSQLLNQPISNTVATVLGGMSKVLIGDVIELARDLQDKEEVAERRRRNLPDPAPGAEPEPLLPSYVREAWTIYKRDTGTVPGSKTKLGSMNRMF